MKSPELISHSQFQEGYNCQKFFYFSIFFIFVDMSWLPLLLLSEKSKIKDTRQPVN